MFVNCAVEKNIPIEASIDTSANVNCIHISIRNYIHSENNNIKTPITSYSRIHSSWTDYYPNLVPWFRENGATLDICNSKLSLDNNFTIPFGLCDVRLRAHISFPS